jgi:hypothetical protein
MLKLGARDVAVEADDQGLLKKREMEEGGEEGPDDTILINRLIRRWYQWLHDAPRWLGVQSG